MSMVRWRLVNALSGRRADETSWSHTEVTRLAEGYACVPHRQSRRLCAPSHRECDYTYGYLTKSGRMDLELPKTHYHDAFVIAGGTHQNRAEPIFIEQIRRNDRSLQKFYDAKYIDIRTGKKESGQTLNNGRRTRNKNHSGENLRVYREQKVSKGRVSIRRQRYQFQPNDMVVFEKQKYRVKGVQNYGAYVKLDGLSKPVRTDMVTPLRWRKGLCVAL